MIKTQIKQMEIQSNQKKQKELQDTLKYMLEIIHNNIKKNKLFHCHCTLII